MKKFIFYISWSLCIAVVGHTSVLQFLDDSDTAMHKKIEKNSALYNLDSLNMYFLNQGYLDVSITKKTDTLQILLGDLYMLQDLYINTKPVNKSPRQKAFKKENVNFEIDKILQKEKETGFQFATVTVESTVVKNNFVDIFCSLNEGPQVILDSLKFEGLTKTHDKLLYKYITFDDTLITSKLLRTVENDARAIPFIYFVPPIKQELLQGYRTANLIVPFKEKSNLLFEGGGGYLSESDLFVWNMSLDFQNIFGGGQNISIVSQKKDVNHQYLQFQYKQPIFLFGIGSVALSVQTRDYREQFYEFLLNSQLQTSLNKKTKIGFYGQYKSVEQDNNNLSYRAAQFSFSIQNNNLKQSKYMSHTFLYNWKFSYGNRKYSGDTNSFLALHSSFNESRIEINNKYYTTLKYPLTFFVEMNFQSYQTDETLPPLAELYLVGGTHSIRGFKDEQFPSIRNITASFEPQYRFSEGNIFLFYDGGYIYNRTSSDLYDFQESTIYRYGYGGGISLQNSSNALKISFGWTKNLTFDNPRISLELKTQL